MKLVLQDAEARHYLAGLGLETRLDAMTLAFTAMTTTFNTVLDRLAVLEIHVSEITDQLMADLASAKQEAADAQTALDTFKAAEDAEDVQQAADKDAAVAAKQAEIDTLTARVAELEAQLAGGVPAADVPAVTASIADLRAQIATLKADIPA